MKKIILGLSVFLTTNVMAYQVATGKIATVNVNTSSVIVGWGSNITNSDSCSNSNSVDTLILPLTDSTKAQFSALLSANVSGKNARVLYDGCLAGLPQIIRVDLVQ